MPLSPFLKPIAIISTLLDCLSSRKDIRSYLPVVEGYTPWMQSIDTLADNCSMLVHSGIADGTFFLGLNGHGNQGNRLDILFSSSALKLAASMDWVPLFPLDEERHKLILEQQSCLLEALLLIFYKFKAGCGMIFPAYGESSCLYAVCHYDTSAFKLMDADGKVLKEGNWLKLLDIFENREEAENGLERYWA